MGAEGLEYYYLNRGSRTPEASNRCLSGWLDLGHDSPRSSIVSPAPAASLGPADSQSRRQLSPLAPRHSPLVRPPARRQPPAPANCPAGGRKFNGVSSPAGRVVCHWRTCCRQPSRAKRRFAPLVVVVVVIVVVVVVDLVRVDTSAGDGANEPKIQFPHHGRPQIDWAARDRWPLGPAAADKEMKLHRWPRTSALDACRSLANS